MPVIQSALKVAGAVEHLLVLLTEQDNADLHFGKKLLLLWVVYVYTLKIQSWLNWSSGFASQPRTVLQVHKMFWKNLPLYDRLIETSMYSKDVVAYDFAEKQYLVPITSLAPQDLVPDMVLWTEQMMNGSPHLRPHACIPLKSLAAMPRFSE